MAANAFTVNILGRDFQIACPPEEEESLRRSARHLTTQMEELKTRAPSLPYERLAVLAALNTTHDFLKKAQEVSTTESMSTREIKQLEKKIDSALSAAMQMEI
jgi:cell division protein ZapA